MANLELLLNVPDRSVTILTNKSSSNKFGMDWMCSYNLERGTPILVIDFRTFCIIKLTQSKTNGSSNSIQ